MDERTRTTLRLSKALHRAVRIRAAREGRDVTAIMTELLKAYLKTPIRKKGGKS